MKQLFINTTNREILKAAIFWYLKNVLDMFNGLDGREEPDLCEILDFTEYHDEPMENAEILMEAIETREYRANILIPFFIELTDDSPDFIDLSDKLKEAIDLVLNTRLMYIEETELKLETDIDNLLELLNSK